MMRVWLIPLAFLSPFLFPWPLTAALALAAAWISPLIPLAVGILVDALYYAHGATFLVPWATVIGGLVALLAAFVRRFLETSIMHW